MDLDLLAKDFLRWEIYQAKVLCEGAKVYRGQMLCNKSNTWQIAARVSPQP